MGCWNSVLNTSQYFGGIRTGNEENEKEWRLLTHVRESKTFSFISNSKLTVPTIVTAHTFCASRDTRVSYGWCLLIQGYFYAV